MTFAMMPKSQGHTQPPKRATSVISWTDSDAKVWHHSNLTRWSEYFGFYLFFLYIYITDFYMTMKIWSSAFWIFFPVLCFSLHTSMTLMCLTCVQSVWVHLNPLPPLQPSARRSLFKAFGLFLMCQFHSSWWTEFMFYWVYIDWVYD